MIIAIILLAILFLIAYFIYGFILMGRMMWGGSDDEDNRLEEFINDLNSQKDGGIIE